MEKAELQRIADNRAEYVRLKNDSNYTDVKFSENTGGLLAIHKDHNFDSAIGRFGIPRGDYERIVAEVLYNYGRSVVLQSEQLGENEKTPDGLLDGHVFDIKTIEGAGKNTIKRKFAEASLQECRTIVLYFHEQNTFSLQRIIDGYSHYLRNSNSKRINTVYYIVGSKVHRV
jgi:hypothetical protein